MKLICEVHALKICKTVMNVIYGNFMIDNLKSFDVWDDLQCDQCGVSQQGLWLYPLWVE